MSLIYLACLLIRNFCWINDKLSERCVVWVLNVEFGDFRVFQRSILVTVTQMAPIFIRLTLKNCLNFSLNCQKFMWCKAISLKLPEIKVNRSQKVATIQNLPWKPKSTLLSNLLLVMHWNFTIHNQNLINFMPLETFFRLPFKHLTTSEVQ